MEKCSFTGHRIISQCHEGALRDLLQRAIDYAYSEGCRSFFCGGAIGFDMLAARAVLLKRMRNPDIRLVIVAPCRDQDATWGERDKASYEFILSEADEIIYVSDGYSSDCLRKRNMKLAELCDIMIAFSGNDRSGSAQTVRMAQKLGKMVYNLFPTVNKSRK